MDRFTIVEGYYVFLTLHHEGQWSDKYARLCHILSYFTPGLAWSETKALRNPEVKEVYDYLKNHYRKS